MRLSLNIVMIHATIMFQDRKYWVANSEIVPNHVSAINLALSGAFAQHKKTRGVVYLRIDEHNANDSGIADGTGRLQEAKFSNLRKYVWGCVEEHPTGLIPTYAD